MSRRDTRTPEQQEFDERIERANAFEARMDETLTRREAIEAIEAVASEYGGCGYHDTDLICNAFRKLAEALS